MTTLHGAPLPEDFEDNAPLPAADFNAVKNYWVTDELPDTAEDGDVVFVVESDPFDPNATPGLPGVGEWATITGVSGTYDKYEYNDGVTDWVVYQWESGVQTPGLGTVTHTAGLMELFLVGAGCGSGSNKNGGGGGQVDQRIAIFGDATVTPTNISAAPRGLDNPHPQRTEVGTYYVFSGNGADTSGGMGAGPNRGANATQWAGGGAGGIANGQTPGIGITSTFADGVTPVEYGRGGLGGSRNDDVGDWSNGQGADGGGSRLPGAGGVAMIRVPAANAQSVAENFHGWLSFATVENGVVTSVNKTPDNIPYTTAVDEIPCGPEVAEGWNYDGSEFVAPEPDYSEQIKELEETLKNLRSAK